jgi:hypothetical protein
MPAVICTTTKISRLKSVIANLQLLELDYMLRHTLTFALLAQSTTSGLRLSTIGVFGFHVNSIHVCIIVFW